MSRVRLSELVDAFEELGRIQRGPDGAPDLLQFRAMVTARQYRHLYDAVSRHFQPGETMLDWGCGNGHVSWTLLRLGFGPVTAYSFDDFPLRSRMPRAQFVLRLGDGADPVRLPFPDESFDGVLSVGVLEHVRETGGAEAESLAEIRRILRPGGRFLCAHFPNRRSWIEFLTRRIPGKSGHAYLYDEAQVRSLAGEMGFELLEHRLYGLLPRNAWARLPRTLRRSRMAATIWDGMDRVLEAMVPVVAQNHLWVARRPHEEDP